MESESRLGRMRLAPGQAQRHCSRRQDPSWPPAMETVQEERAGSQAYRVSGTRVLHGDGLAAQCVESLQMPLAVPGKC